tara:strand:+ start:1651 stop:2964 length:1314 start_codon:yes stop_codon:yes gene_type:complete
VDEAALRMSLSLAQSPECTSASSTLSVVAMPAVDMSQSLSDEQVDLIRSEYLIALGSELPSCTRLTDAIAAFGTIEFMTEVDSSGRITDAQQDLIESKLQNAHSILVLKIEKLSEKYQATAQLTSISEGQTISVTRYNVPEQQTRTECGVNAAAEKRGLAKLADDMLSVLNPIKGLHVKNGLYQDTDETSGYGSYIAQQFLVALTNERKERVFKSEFPIKIHRENSVVDDGEYELTLRYWVCDDNKSANLTVTAEAPDGNSGVFTQSLSLQLLPSGVDYVPENLGQQDQLSVSEDREQSSQPFWGLMSVLPKRVSSGELLSISAEPPADCNPFFFDLASGGKLTPLPLNIFDITEIRAGFIRYDNNEQSKYGITIQPEDERGAHRMGFVCQPQEMTNEDIRGVFKDLRSELVNREAGEVEKSNLSIIFNTSQYVITE